MEDLAYGALAILLVIGFIAFVVWVIKAIINSAKNNPTWKGVIISAIFGILPFYLILCFFGVMGEKRNTYDRL